MPRRVVHRHKITVHVFDPGTAEARVYCAGEGRFFPLIVCQSCPHFGGLYKPEHHKNTVIRCLPTLLNQSAMTTEVSAL